jgi:hypothetical protein
MLDTTEIAIFAALGLVFAAALVFLARWSHKGAPRLAAYALIALSFIYVGLAIRSENPPAWIAVEMTGVAIFGSLGLMSIIGSPWFVVAGLLIQPLWALQFHYLGTGSVFVPPVIPIANAAFDVALALYIAFVVLRDRAAPTAAASEAQRPARQKKDRVR